jgi:hypothetical protein
MQVQLICTRCGTKKLDLFKLKENVWEATGFDMSDHACMDCVEKALGRLLSAAGLDPAFPWWGAPREYYYQGIVDGFQVAAPAFEKQTEYAMGVRLGNRIAQNSTRGDIEAFVRAASPRVK